MSSVGSDDMGISAQNRREEADELLTNIQAGHVNADTLEVLIQILDYECLHLKPITQDDLPRRRQSDSVALQPSWTDRLVTILARCMCQVTRPTSYYQREVQYRALLSALALQRARGAKSFQVDHYNELQRQFGQGHKDLQWQQVPPTEFSTEKYRIYNCHFLLVTIVEYAKNFKRDEPAIAKILNRAMNILLVGSTIALAASTNVRTHFQNLPLICLMRLSPLPKGCWRPSRGVCHTHSHRELWAPTENSWGAIEKGFCFARGHKIHFGC